MDNSTLDNKRIAKNTLFLYFRMLLIMLVNLYTSRVVLNTLGVVDYGVYNVVGGVVVMFAFLNSALAQATQRFIAFGIKRDNIVEQQKMFSMLLNVHVIIAFVVILLCETIGLWFLYNKLVIPSERLFAAFIVMQSSILVTAISITQVPYNASIYGHEKMNVYAYISIVEALLKLAAVVSLIFYFSDKLIAYSILLLIISAIIAICYRYYCVKVFDNCKYVFCWSKEIIGEVMGYTSWSLLGNLAWTMNGQGMNVIINLFFGPIYNAARGIAVAVESAVSSFLYNFTGAAIPQIIKKYAAGDYEGMKSLSFKSSKFGFLLFMCISVPLISIMNNVLNIWLVTPPPISNQLCILSLIYVQINSMPGTLQNVVQATGDVRNFQISNGVLKIFALPCVYLLYKVGAPVTSYLYILICFSVLGLLVQLYVVSNQVPNYSKSQFLRLVVLPELQSYFIPIIVALILSRFTYPLELAILIFIIMIVVSALSSWYIGMNVNERVWVVRNIGKFLDKFK